MYNKMADLTNKYQKKTDKQHILDNPDTYIGSVENVDQHIYILDDNNKIVSKEINYIPGLYKLFDEGKPNAIDPDEVEAIDTLAEESDD